MTTIAYRDGIMACDSAISMGNHLWSFTQKIVQGRNFAAGAAGDLVEAVQFLEWAKSGFIKTKKPEEDLEEFEGIVAYPDRILFYNSKLSPIELVTDFVAIGSGTAFAMGAMAHGASAEEAVAIACQYDNETSGPIHKIKIY
jgi:20S proteasome alpha/beta subunit